jgi:cytochrome c biogenesis protein CcdA
VGLVLLCALAACGRADPALPKAPGPPGLADVEFFTREGCPYCAKAAVWLAGLQKDRPTLTVKVHPLLEDPDALARLRALADAAGVQAGTPALYAGGELIVGWKGDATARRVLAALDRPAEVAPASEPEERTLEVPIVGTVNLKDLGLPALTVLLGLLDGFNPCAMWVLVFLLSILVNLKSRSKMLAVAGTFVLVSGLVYFTFMAAWLHLHRWIGLYRAVQVALALLAIFVGLVNVKDFFWFHRGITLSIPEGAKPGIYERARRIVRAENAGAALAGVVALAVMVNFVELLCTAGLPAVYTNILAQHDLPLWQHYGYLLLYQVFYMLDDSLLLLIAVITLSRRRLQERQGRVLKLVSGMVMLLLGLLLLFRPEVLAG